MRLEDYLTGNGRKTQDNKPTRDRIRIISAVNQTPQRGQEIAKKLRMKKRRVNAILGSMHNKTRVLKRQEIDMSGSRRQIFWSIRTGHEEEVTEGILVAKKAL